MGACLSQTSGSAAENLNSKQLDALNEAAFRTEQAKIKLLLLGAGESGKSTVFKQMKILYGAVPTEADMKQMIPIIFVNIMAGIKALANQIALTGQESALTNQDEFRKIMCMRDDIVISVEIAGILSRMWMDPITQSIWERRSEFQIVDSVKTYLNDLTRITAPDYIPTQADLLLCRVRTTGIATERYVIDNSVFEMYDVGGQRNERKKWIHCFDNVTAVMFVAALSEYDQTLFEDDSTNRMIEAIHLFDEICNNCYFSNSAMILFLNKRDLFADKILTKDIDSISQFSDYSGPRGNYDAGVQYFLKKFLSVNKVATKAVYHHITCATDTSNIQVVFNACKDIILRGSLQETGFI